MQECYIDNKICSLLHVKRKSVVQRMQDEKKVAAIMNAMHEEITHAVVDLEYRLIKMLRVHLNENL